MQKIHFGQKNYKILENIVKTNFQDIEYVQYAQYAWPFYFEYAKYAQYARYHAPGEYKKLKLQKL